MRTNRSDTAQRGWLSYFWHSHFRNKTIAGGGESSFERLSCTQRVSALNVVMDEP